MLRALLRDSRLTPKERKAFEGMLRTVSGRRLTNIQRGWVQDTFTKYQPALVSEPPATEEPKPTYESMPRPMKPPGRK
jgi:hypothetical protein